MENPYEQMDDLGGNPLFSETSIYYRNFNNWLIPSNLTSNINTRNWNFAGFERWNGMDETQHLEQWKVWGPCPWLFSFFEMGWHTVDGRNPAPVDMVKIPLFTGCHTCWVVQDFFHQQYHPELCGDLFHKPWLSGSLLNTQYNGKYLRFFFVAHVFFVSKKMTPTNGKSNIDTKNIF